MNSAGAHQSAPKAPKLSDRYGHLIERYLNVMIAMVTVGILVIYGRTVQMGGWDIIHATQIILACALWVVLVARRYLPNFMVIGAIYFSIFAFVMMGAFRFGMLEPALYLFVGLPVASAVIWGLIPGLVTLTLVLMLLTGLAAKFLFFDPGVPFDAEAYIMDQANWVIFLISIGINSLWCMLLVSLQRQFWIKANDDLHSEHEAYLDSERRRAAARMRWDSLAANIPGVLFEYVRHPDGSRSFENVSEGSMEIWGISPDDIHDNPDVVVDRLSPVATVTMSRAFDESAVKLEPFSVRFQSEANDTDSAWVQVRGRPEVEDSGAIRWYCVALDITREVAAETEARTQSHLALQAQKQKAIGQLTAGISHDFNNLLAVVVGTLELVREDEKTEEWHDLIDNAMHATRQGIDLTRNMLSFSRQAPLEPTVLNLNELIDTTQTWFRRTLPANVAVNISAGSDLLPVKVDESSTVSALLNLVVNARDAMPGGGSIQISTENKTVTEDCDIFRGDVLATGRYVQVTVTDTGEGMDKETLTHVFEPFFTTKAPGAGTGLGLPMVYGFMKQSGGTVLVTSTVGEGTCFKLFFPADETAQSTTASTATVSEPTKPAAPTGAANGARLLVVEDEPLILANLQKALTRLGYDIATATSGDQAAKVLEKDHRFDLMLTDIMMPGRLQGTQLAEHARDLIPNLPVIYMSGYSSAFAEMSNQPDLQEQLLVKPVRRADLISAIETQLERAKAS